MKVLDNNIDSLLSEIGLNESERTVYLAGSSSGATSAELLARTRMPRPTVMAALKSLRAYKLCQTYQRDGRSLLYKMQPVTALKQHLGERAREIDSLIERLDAVPSQDTSLVITEGQGQSQLKDLLEQALRCKSRQWQIIAPYNNALRFMPADYIAYFKRIRSERQITSQTLWGNETATKNLGLKDILMRKPRYVPADLSKEVPTLLLAFDNSLLVIEGTSNPKAAIITAPSVVKTYQLIFEMAWRNAEK